MRFLLFGRMIVDEGGEDGGGDVFIIFKYCVQYMISYDFNYIKKQVLVYFLIDRYKN